MEVIPDIKISNNAIIRCASWPINIAFEFISTSLLKETIKIFEHEKAIRTSSQKLIDELFKIIPRISDKTTRSILLDIKRNIHKSNSPFQSLPSDIESKLSSYPDLLTQIQNELCRRKDLDDLRKNYEGLYDSELIAQKKNLIEIVCKPRFKKAMIIDNPATPRLYKQLKNKSLIQTPICHKIEKTFFNYLMRAIGRPTPNNLWAGISMVDFEASESKKTISYKVLQESINITVKLKPFEVALKALACLPVYRFNFPVRLNSTIVSDQLGWIYEKHNNNFPSLNTIPNLKFCELLFEFFSDGISRKISPFLDELLGKENTERHKFEKIIDALFDANVLVVDFMLPLSSNNVWSVLTFVANKLLLPEKLLWQNTISQIESLCEKLGENFNNLSPREIEFLLSSIRNEIQKIWDNVGIDKQVPKQIINLDYLLPYKITAKKKYQTKLSDTLKEYIGFHSIDGGAALYQNQTLMIIGDMIGNNQNLLDIIIHANKLLESTSNKFSDKIKQSMLHGSIENIFNRFPKTNSLHNLISKQNANWISFIENSNTIYKIPTDSIDTKAFPGFFGSILFPLWHHNEICVGQGRPQIGLFFSRMSYFLKNRGGYKYENEIREWFKKWEKLNIKSGELYSHDTSNLNASLRPNVTSYSINVHNPVDLHPQNLAVIYDEKIKKYWLQNTLNGEKILLVCNSGAEIGQKDVSTRLLWNISMTWGWEYLSFGIPPIESEFVKRKHLPRHYLPCGAIVSRESWIIDSDTLLKISSLNGPQLFLSWIKLMSQLGISNLAYINFGDHNNDILFITKSPLAVSLLFYKIKKHPLQSLIIKEFPCEIADLPLQDNEGNKYIGELALSWILDNPEDFFSKNPN